MTLLEDIKENQEIMIAALECIMIEEEREEFAEKKKQIVSRNRPR